MPIAQSLVLLDRSSDPRSTTLAASTLTITSPMRLQLTPIRTFNFRSLFFDNDEEIYMHGAHVYGFLIDIVIA